MKTLGQRMKARRLVMALSQLEMAALCGVSNVTVSKLESDKNHVMAVNLAGIARGMATQTGYISDEQEKERYEWQRLAEALERFYPPKKKTVISLSQV